MTISSWSDRPIEQARLLNPAFLAALIWSCAEGYGSIDEQGIPYPLTFVAMPIVLHKSTRESLPRAIRTSLAAWLGENPQVHVRFAERATALVPLIKEGVLFGANGQMLNISSSQIVAEPRPRSMSRFLRESSDEVQHCMKKAKFVGKWFASSGDYTTVMTLFGVMP
ncbi:three component ABC system middle component [Leptothoe sp. PORK10 BA2]|uniref:three component ABC system middle component n=1 Tax=Leptothoe sp. PORK10 BA2 TaxID=3110254 RepID=UPI002B203D4E|nr:three component ABC system middle component [Leptothoe sp. PORK10 BA2]MEA5463789.1 three component ABC system middle component [Leptothoe sp. PORK10 BA2]